MIKEDWDNDGENWVLLTKRLKAQRLSRFSNLETMKSLFRRTEIGLNNEPGARSTFVLAGVGPCDALWPIEVSSILRCRISAIARRRCAAQCLSRHMAVVDRNERQSRRIWEHLRPGLADY